MMKTKVKRSKNLVSRNLFALRLRTLRHEKNMTQEELAKRIGVTRASISNWEKGLRSPDCVSIEYMSHLFGVPSDYLYGTSNHRYNIKVPDYFELDFTKLNGEGMFMLYEYYKLLIGSEDYRSK